MTIKCDRALQSAEETIEKKNEVIGAQEKAMSNCTKRIAELKEEKKDKWYENETLWLGVGMIIGAGTTAGLTTIGD